MAIYGLDSSVLLGFYSAQRSASPSAIAAGNTRAAQLAALQKKGATANDDPPWNTIQKNDSSRDAKSRGERHAETDAETKTDGDPEADSKAQTDPQADRNSKADSDP